MSKDVYCIFHSTGFDGKCSAKIVEKFYNEKNINVNFIPIDYGQTFDIKKEIPQENQIVVMVDFSFSSDIMKEIYYEHDLIWIDHHERSITDAKDTPYQFCDGWRSLKLAACQLTWLYFFGTKKTNETNMTPFNIDSWDIEKEIPLAVNLLGWYDINDIRKHRNIISFQFGINLVNNTFKNKIWDALFEGNTKTINLLVNKGRLIHAHMSKVIKDISPTLTYDLSIDGLKAIVINSPPYFPRTLLMKEIFDETKYDFCILFYKIKKGWKVTFMSTKPELNMNELVRKYKGGGHKGIASFKTQNITPFLNIENNRQSNNKFNKSYDKRNNNQSKFNNFNKSNGNNERQYNKEHNKPNLTTIREFGNRSTSSQNYNKSIQKSHIPRATTHSSK